MATQPMLKMQSRELVGRTAYRSVSLAGGDDTTPIKGLMGNESVVVGLTGTVTSVMPETRMVDTDPWTPCLSAVLAAPQAVTLFNVLDQLRVNVTTGTGVFATVLVRRPG